MRKEIKSLANLDKIQLVGFLMSAVVAFFLLLTGQDSLISITLGFVLAALTQLFDLQMRLKDVEKNLLRTNTLSKKLYRDEWLYKHIEEIVNDYQLIQMTWFEVFHQYAQDILIESHNSIHSLAEGRMVVEARSPYNFGITGINYAEESLKAVTLSDNKFWSSVWGKNYLDTNAEVVKRGVQIVRVFMNTPEKLEELKEVFEKHLKAGIEVYTVSIDRADKQLHNDFIIMDNKFVNRAEHSGMGQIQYWIQSTEQVDVERACRKFDAIFRMAYKPTIER